MAEDTTETFFRESPELDNVMNELREFMLENNITPEELREDLNNQKSGLMARIKERRQFKNFRRGSRIDEIKKETRERRLEEGYEILSPYIVAAGSRQKVFEALKGSGVDLEDKKQLIEWIEKECKLGKLNKSPFALSDLEDLEKQGKIKIVREELKANGSYHLEPAYFYDEEEDEDEEAEEEAEDDETDDMSERDNCQIFYPISANSYLLTRDGQLIDVFVDNEKKKVILFIPPES